MTRLLRLSLLAFALAAPAALVPAPAGATVAYEEVAQAAPGTQAGQPRQRRAGASTQRQRRPQAAQARSGQRQAAQRPRRQPAA